MTTTDHLAWKRKSSKCLLTIYTCLPVILSHSFRTASDISKQNVEDCHHIMSGKHISNLWKNAQMVIWCSVKRNNKENIPGTKTKIHTINQNNYIQSPYHVIPPQMLIALSSIPPSFIALLSCSPLSHFSSHLDWLYKPSCFPCSQSGSLSLLEAQFIKQFDE